MFRSLSVERESSQMLLRAEVGPSTAVVFDGDSRPLHVDAQQWWELEPRRYRFRAGRVADHVAPAREQRRAIDADAGERQARLALRDDPAAGVEHEVAARVMRRVVDQHQVRIASRLDRKSTRLNSRPQCPTRMPSSTRKKTQ